MYRANNQIGIGLHAKRSPPRPSLVLPLLISSCMLGPGILAHVQNVAPSIRMRACWLHSRLSVDAVLSPTEGSLSVSRIPHPMIPLMGSSSTLYHGKNPSSDTTCIYHSKRVIYYPSFIRHRRRALSPASRLPARSRARRAAQSQSHSSSDLLIRIRPAASRRAQGHQGLTTHGSTFLHTLGQHPLTRPKLVT